MKLSGISDEPMEFSLWKYMNLNIVNGKWDFLGKDALGEDGFHALFF